MKKQIHIPRKEITMNPEDYKEIRRTNLYYRIKELQEIETQLAAGRTTSEIQEYIRKKAQALEKQLEYEIRR